MKLASSYDVSKKAICESKVFDECDIDDSIKEKLLEDIRKRLTPQAVKIRADIEVGCFNYGGIDAIKAALLEGLKLTTETMPIKINLIAPPQYVVTTNTLEREDGLKLINDCLAVIKKNIESEQGTFKVTLAPKVVTELEEKAIRKRLELLELEGVEVDDEEEVEDDDGLQAPKELDQAADAEDAEKKARGDGDKEKEGSDEEEEGED